MKRYFTILIEKENKNGLLTISSPDNANVGDTTTINYFNYKIIRKWNNKKDYYTYLLKRV